MSPGTPARVAAAFAVAVACAGVSPTTGEPAQLTGEQLLARVKAVFRSYPRPPYIAYTLVRRDRHNGAPDFENSYTLKIWCRTADRSALARRAWRGAAYGSLQNITVLFDKEVDPGPPTADMFEKRLFGAVAVRGEPRAARPTPAPATPQPLSTTYPEIGRVSALDGDYRVSRVTHERDLLHLWLEARSDPERNRLDEIWVDGQTYDLRRARVRDHLYLGMTGQAIDDEFDVKFKPGPGGLPLIAAIHGETKYGQYETDYAFEDITFPDALPAWYFTPAEYGLHRSDAPS